MTSYFKNLRVFGAQLRRVLIENAAQRLGVPAEELATEPSIVVHRRSGRRLSYAEIAGFAEVPDKAPEIKPEALKKASEFRLIGHDVMRVELPHKVDGSAQYSIDVELPGMVYGAVIRAPVEGSGPDQVDDRKAKAVAGVLDIVRLPYGVGVLAQTPWAAFAARQALLSGVTWKRTGTAWGLDSDQAVESFAAAARNLDAEASDWDKQGDARHDCMRKAREIASLRSQ